MFLQIPAYLFQKIEIKTVSFTAFLEVRNVIPGRNGSLFRIDPAAQGFKSAGCTGERADDRLIIRNEGSCFQCIYEMVVHKRLFGALLIECFIIDTEIGVTPGGIICLVRGVPGVIHTCEKIGWPVAGAVMVDACPDNHHPSALQAGYIILYFSNLLCEFRVRKGGKKHKMIDFPMDQERIREILLDCPDDRFQKQLTIAVTDGLIDFCVAVDVQVGNRPFLLGHQALIKDLYRVIQTFQVICCGRLFRHWHW